MSADSGESSSDTTESRFASEEPPEGERAPNTLVNGLLGGIAGILLGFIPFSTVLGGGIAGYLEGGDSTTGAKVGALAGLIAFVPLVFIIGIVLVFVPVVSVPGPGVQVALWVSILLVGMVAAIYTVGLGALGGVLGVYLKENV